MLLKVSLLLPQLFCNVEFEFSWFPQNRNTGVLINDFVFALDSPDKDLWNIDLLDTYTFRFVWYRYPGVFCLQGVLKMSSRHVFRTSSLHVFKASSRRFQHNNVSSPRRLQDVFKSSCEMSQDVFKTSSRRFQRNNFSSPEAFQDIFKSSCKMSQDVFNTSSRRLGRRKFVTLKTRRRRLQDGFKTNKCLLASNLVVTTHITINYSRPNFFLKWIFKSKQWVECTLRSKNCFQFTKWEISFYSSS